MQLARFISVGLFISSVFAPTVAMTGQCPNRDHEFAVNFGTFTSWSRKLSSARRLAVPVDGHRYVRILIRPLAEESVHWTIRIRDANGRPIQSTDSSQVSGDAFWTNRIYEANPVLYVESESRGPVAETLFIQTVGNEDATPFYSVKDASGEPDWSDVYDPTDDAGGPVAEFWRWASEPIGLFVASAGNNIDGVSVWSCSGVLVSAEPEILFLTNYHCGGTREPMWTKDVCPNNGFVDFSWDGDDVSRQYLCEAVMHRSSERDLALLRLSVNESDVLPRPAELAESFSAGEVLTMIHHPASETKKISRGCSALDIPGFEATDIFAHVCDTESGSSGAPILNNSGRLVGIHHTGYETNEGNCDGLNKAAGLDSIKEFLRAAGIQPH